MGKVTGFNAPRELLAALEGSWKGTTKTFMEPYERNDESAWSGRISLLFDGRFAMHEYDGEIQSNKLSGKAIIGYNISRGRWEIAWVDSFHTGGAIMFSTGGAWEGGAMECSFVVLGSYPDPSGGPDWGWRTEVRVESRDKIVITHFNIEMPSGEESIGVETVYERA